MRRGELLGLRWTVIALRALGEWPDEVNKWQGHTSVAFTLHTDGQLPKWEGNRGRFDSLLTGRRQAIVSNLSKY